MSETVIHLLTFGMGNMCGAPSDRSGATSVVANVTCEACADALLKAVGETNEIIRIGERASHFPGCHPEDAKDPRPDKAADEIQETEECWHCGTPTPHGCDCAECMADADVISPTAIYHCPTCGRWWAYMTGLKLTTITFGEPGAEVTSP